MGANLAALSGLFDRLWDRPSVKLTQADRGFILNQAGLCLIALGWLKEATQPIGAALEAAIAQEHWANASASTANLSELSLALGEVTKAVAYAERSVELADRSGDGFSRMSRRTTLADALHQAGLLDESEASCREAEMVQKQRQPETPFLYALGGFRYCDLLLDQVEPLVWPSLLRVDAEQFHKAYKEVISRAGEGLEIAERNGQLLSIGLDHLTLGRAHLLAAQLESTSDFAEATEHLDRAVDGLRQAGTQHHIPRGLLARAVLRRVQKQYREAWADVEEAMEIAEPGEMGLFQADGLLESARLHWEEGDAEQARTCLDRAKKMIDETGYHRRDREVAALERVLSEGAEAET